jgi:putative flippase GtrA
MPEIERLRRSQVIINSDQTKAETAASVAVLYAGLALGLGLYGGRAVSYLAAATTTWALNRLWTFRGRGDGPVHRQWALFLLVNLVGFAMNYGTYAALIEFVPMVAAHPVLGVAAGALAGMFGNFVLSRQLVFRTKD